MRAFFKLMDAAALAYGNVAMNSDAPDHDAKRAAYEAAKTGLHGYIKRLEDDRRELHALRRHMRSLKALKP